MKLIAIKLFRNITLFIVSYFDNKLKLSGIQAELFYFGIMPMKS